MTLEGLIPISGRYRYRDDRATSARLRNLFSKIYQPQSPLSGLGCFVNIVNKVKEKRYSEAGTGAQIEETQSKLNKVSHTLANKYT